MNKTSQSVGARKYSQQIEALVEKMTVAEKIGQLRCKCGLLMKDEDERARVVEDVRSGRTGNFAYLGEFDDRLMLQKVRW